jgi:hypothetical protein
MALEQKQNKEKEILISSLKEMPILHAACKRAGISRATYYRWREDAAFAKQIDEALTEGFEYVSDMSEAQLIALAKEKKLGAIQYWLKHHRRQYGYAPKKTRTDEDGPVLTEQQRDILKKALRLAHYGTRKI